jgi:hypothetical protein
VPRRSVLNVVGLGITITDNKLAGRTDLSLPATASGTTITPPTLTSDVNDYLPAGHAGATLERWSADATPRNVTGLDAGGLPRLVICNVGATTITLKHESASSLAANRFTCPASADFALTQAFSVALVRDPVSLRWRVVT